MSDLLAYKEDRPLKINILLNPLSKGAEYKISLNEEKYSQDNFLVFKDKKDKNEKEKEYNFKERIVYNNLPTDYINQTKSDSTNTYYFENFFELIKDFDYSNYIKLINMRINYLKSIFKTDKKAEEKLENLFKDIKEKEEKKDEKDEKEGKKDEKKDEKEKEDEKEEKEKKDEKEKNEINEEKVEKEEKEEKEEKKEKEKIEDKKENIFNEEEIKNKDMLYSLINDLANMMNYQKDQGDQFLYYSILERIFSNIFFEIETFLKEIDLKIHSLYEIKLCECIDLFEKNFISKDEDLNSKTIHFLEQFQKLSLSLKSCGAFFKILQIMKSKNISFDNYKSINNKYFQTKDIINSIKEGKNKNMENCFEISLDYEITNYEFCTDDEYLYICYNSYNKNFFKLGKYYLETGKKVLEKEIENYVSFSILNDDINNNKINILIYKKENEFELLIINKNDFLIEKKN